ncbi:MAG: phosphoribosylamine--glycine ligase [Syntrophomonadaceae bacterium]|nr:phosphoribosylamine--glycine ligase [Syntrophomonadaceae bacterium]MDD4548347.1 phosphoribosylamine--glycine ligase [Syntrophomonadaceae bacterium]
MGKKVLVIGQGGREHALVWKLAQSPRVEKIYAAPGNPGIAKLAECIAISAGDVEQLLQFARDNNIDLTVVGPEAPLMDGIVDRFQQAGLKIFGPTARAAELEGSKVFTKNLLKKYGIPTAEFEVFDEIELARNYARFFTDQGKKVVIKVDGLAAGKGVIVANDWEEASQAIDSMLKEKSFGSAGNKIIVEECLIGQEVSFFAISDGENIVSLVSAQDHKQVFDNDGGPNTGGMGAYINPPVFTAEVKDQVINQIIRPVIEAMRKEGRFYQGVLFAGLMLTDAGPKVLEFNARFGDPETQAIMPALKGDLYTLFETAVNGELKDYEVAINEGASICVVLASKGYPGAYDKGKVIRGLEDVSRDTVIFHAGTVEKDDQLLTNGGRVLAVVVQGANMAEAINKVYNEVKKIHFNGMHFRTDIGRKALKR